ncbi:PHP domain-containing protein [Roseisolibacter sp. H3M3-2]|uniref:PHP domain-containing protein n=1 Tax=Roseisolibacter sp. H3M3-2 TaxID=3031323 RepID=UPI0023DC4CDD|nr:PHP domain-containing protein [Roseisolibacter sp. H3M3-2]MDF1502979.1 PHP domain-containing protein [Roseisolibacter sp. H3M3-2]
MTAPAAAGPFVDLHAHSTASDGHLPPAAVVEAARAASLAAMALTDHDTVAGVPEAQAAGDALGVRVVAGCELSAHLGDDEIHLLALHLDRVDVIAGELTRFRDDRVARAERMVAILAGQGIAVTMDDVLREAAGGAVGRPHVARAVVAAGGARDIREAFDRFLGDGRPAYVDKPRLDAADAIRLAHAAGGIAVWAHPKGEGRRDNVERLAAAGLDGVEVWHPVHNADDRARLLALAEFFGLVTSGGSDWHGIPDHPRALGIMQVPIEVLERQDARVAARRRAGADVARG